MDKYDIFMILEYIKERLSNLKDLYDEGIFYKTYLTHKKDFLLRKLYVLNTKRFFKNKNIKHPYNSRIEKVVVLDTRKKYAWDVLAPMPKKKVSK